jgi:uncharacterized membrane protein YgcG
LQQAQQQTSNQIQGLRNIIENVANNNNGGGNINNNNNGGNNNNNNNNGGNNNNNNGRNNNNNNNNNNGGNNNNNNIGLLNNNGMVATLGNNILTPAAAISLATNPFAAAQANPMAYARSNVDLCNKVGADLNVDGVVLELAHTWGPIVLANDPSYIERRLTILAGDMQGGYSPKLRETLKLRAKKTIKQIMEPLTSLCSAFNNNACGDDDVKSALNEIQQHVIFFYGNYNNYSETQIEECINKFRFAGTAAHVNIFKNVTPEFGNNNNNHRNNRRGGGGFRAKSSGGRGRGRGGRGRGGGQGSGNQAAGGTD